MPDTRVLVVADNLLARLGLSALLDTIPDVTVVGQIAGTDEAYLPQELDIYTPDVVVFDLGYDPMALLRRLTTIVEAELPILALLPDTEYATNAIAVLRSASSYGVLKRDSDASLLGVAIQAVKCGLVTIAPDIAESVLPDGDSLAIEPPTEELTPRESEVLQLLAQGLTNKGIAQELSISPNTVKFHINAILTKLNAQSRTEAVVKASRHGLIIL